MNIELTSIEEANLVAHARKRGTTPESIVREAMGPILRGPSGCTENNEAPGPRVLKRHISTIIAERMERLPVEAFESLPVDGASEHDHYLYGAPKRNG